MTSEQDIPQDQSFRRAECEMNEPPFVPLSGYREYPQDEMSERAREFHAELRRRRTVRDFSSRPVPRVIIDDCLRAATTAPSGANLQPWHFVVVGDSETKRRIRVAAKEEERHFYMHRAPRDRSDGRRRPKTAERPFLLLVVGDPDENAMVPDIGRKPLTEVVTYV